MDLSLPVIPFLEVVTTMLLMSWVDFRKVDHFLLELHLSETLVYKQVVLLMHGSVAALARSTEYLETSSQSIGDLLMLAASLINCHLTLNCQSKQRLYI